MQGAEENDEINVASTKLGDLLLADQNESVVVEVEKILRAISSPSVLASVLEKEISAELNGTLLQIAIQKMNLSLVVILMSFDANFNFDSEKSPSISTVDSLILNASSKDKAELQKIRSFILSRKNWKQCTKNSGISLNRVVRLLEKGIDAVPPQIDQELVLIYGETQIGKSTWINYLHGVEYQFVTNASGLMSTAERKGGAGEVVTVGTGGGSETIYPKIILDKAGDDINYKFVDMPGFGDTRNNEERICVVSSNKLLLHKLTNVKVKGLMFAISYHDLTQGAHTNLRRILPKMKRVLNGQYDNFILVITKIPELENKDINLKTRVTNELMKFRSVIEKEINEASHSDNENVKEKKDTEEVLKTIILNNDRIVIGDIFHQDARALVLKSLNLFKAQDPKVFNFDINFDERRADPINVFKESMGCVAREYIDLYNKQEGIKKEGLVLRNNIVLKQNTLNTKDEEIRLTNIKIDKPFTSDDVKIESLKKDIEKLKTCIEVSRDEIYKLKLEPESIRDEIDRMRNNTQLYTIETYHATWDQQPKYEKETGIYEMMFGGSCDSNNPECVTKNKHREIDAMDRGRVKNAMINYTIQQPYLNHTIAIADYRKNKLYGCTFTEGVWLTNENFVADTQQFKKNLQNGVFQGRIDGTVIGDGINKYTVMGTIYVSIALLGQENSKKEVLDDIIAKEKQIAVMEGRLKLEESILNVRLIDQTKKERELQRLNEAPQKDTEEKNNLREELEKLEEHTRDIHEEIQELEKQKQENAYFYKNNEAILQQNFFKKIVTLLDILGLESNELIEFSTLVNNIFLRIEKPSLTDQMYHSITPVMANGAVNYYSLNDHMFIVYDRNNRMSAARETISYQFFMFTIKPINFLLQRTKIFSQQLLLSSFYQYHDDAQQKEEFLGRNAHAITPMLLDDHNYKSIEQNVFFDKGLWDNTVKQCPRTGAPLFTYRVFKNNLEVGSAIFYKHPLICRSEDGTRHNIIVLNGVLAKYDIDKKLQTVENICESLPPTLTQELIQVTVRGVQHGAIKGAANTISYALDKGGFSKRVSYYTNGVIYYGGMFPLHYTYRYQDIAYSNITEVQKMTIAAYQAVVDTATLAFTQTVIHQGCKLINWFGQKAQQYGWGKTGETLQWLSSYGSYGGYAYQAYSQGVLHTGTSIVSGVTSEKIVEKIGKYSVAKLLEMNGFRSKRNHAVASNHNQVDRLSSEIIQEKTIPIFTPKR